MGVAYASCGHGVWVSNAEMCDVRRHWFDRAIHVHHSESPTPGRCKLWDVSRSGERDLFVRYIDGSSLTTALDHNSNTKLSIHQIAEFAKQDGKLLCHCAAGLCRGPTMAVLSKVARGCTPWDAMRDVAQAMWLGYLQSPQLFNLPLTELMIWYWHGQQP